MHTSTMSEVSEGSDIESYLFKSCPFTFGNGWNLEIPTPAVSTTIRRTGNIQSAPRSARPA